MPITGSRRRFLTAALFSLLGLAAAAALMSPPVLGVAARGAEGWAPAPSMLTPREDFGAVAGPDGRVYVAGGNDANGNLLNSAEVYDPTARSWKAIASMPTTRDSVALATGRDGRIYAIGGEIAASHGPAIATVEAYEPTSNRWSTVAPMHTARKLAAAATGADGRIYAISGIDTFYNPLRSVEAYDPQTNTWSDVAPLNTGRGFPAATAGRDQRIYVMGGYGGNFVDAERSNQNGKNLTSVEVYTPATNAWSLAPPMLTPRHTLAAVNGPDGRIYAIGGHGGDGNPLAVVEAFLPGAMRWTEATPLPDARAALGAAVGGDGRMYAMGGRLTAASNGVNSVEAFRTDRAGSAPQTGSQPAGSAQTGLANTGAGRASPAPATITVIVLTVLCRGRAPTRPRLPLRETARPPSTL